ncbi:MAG: DUF2304 domain-containing protein [Candidatus Sumerlaeota bacterium]|nr:DUF2304 domain-containing protein [Candidatus Sumerlaeota bacterium]
MPFPQNIIVISLALALLVFIVSRVYYGQLREEYSWLWLLTGAAIFALAGWSSGLEALRRWLGFVSQANVVVFFGLMFLVFINLHASIKISRLTMIQKNMVQEVAILREEVDRLMRKDSEKPMQNEK